MYTFCEAVKYYTLVLSETGLEVFGCLVPLSIESKLLPFVSSMTKITKIVPNMHAADIKLRHPYIPTILLIMGKYLLIRNEDAFMESVLIDMPIVRIWKGSFVLCFA